MISKAPDYIDLIPDERLMSVMDHFLAPHYDLYQLNSSEIIEIIEIHDGETAQDLHWDDVIWPAHFWAPDKLLYFNVMVAATDFTETNGATRVVPGSHIWDSRIARSQARGSHSGKNEARQRRIHLREDATRWWH